MKATHTQLCVRTVLPAQVLAGAIVASVAAGAAAQNLPEVESYPSRPIRMLVGFSPGGGSDIIARMLGPKLTEAWNQQVVVDNRAGAGGVLASEMTAKAAPNGYTLLMATSSLAIQPNVRRRLPFDTLRDFAPVTLACSAPYVLLLNPNVPANSIKELIALAKAKPGQLNYASAGAGSTLHLSAELFKSMAGVDIVHVPYKGAVAIPDLIAGQVQMAFFGLITALPHVRSGRLRALGITGPMRSATAPDIPTIAEAGVPGYKVTAWYGVLAPAGTHRRIIDKLNAELVKAVQSADVQQQLAAQGIEPVGSTPQQFAALIREETAQWADVVKRAGIPVE